VPELLGSRLRAVGSAVSSAARGALALLGDVLRGAAGTHAYGAYLAHHERHHGDRPPLSREQFFRESLETRWHGVKRCC
jgi:uncharacterized short protein YbdD (DUF466 family)